MPDLLQVASKGIASVRRSVTGGGKRAPERQADGSYTIPGSKTTFVITKEGDAGTQPVERGTNVTVHAVGRVLGREEPFWSTRAEGEQPFSYVCGAGDMIDGWEVGLVGMLLGEKRVLTIPPKEAYGKEGFVEWDIPPKSSLMFEIELLTCCVSRISRPVSEIVDSDGEVTVDAFL